MFKFNIGSAVHGVDRMIAPWQAMAALWLNGFQQIDLIKTEKSDTETTYVITAGGYDDSGDFHPSHETAVHAVCELLVQDAIAYTVDGEGFLVGPKAEDWGGLFIPEYFIE